MYLTMMHDRPTSWPAPSGITSTDGAAAPTTTGSSFPVMVPQGCRTGSTGESLSAGLAVYYQALVPQGSLMRASCC